MGTISIILTTSGALITLVVGGIKIYDVAKSSQIKKAKKSNLPVRIRKSINYSQLYDSLETAHDVLDEMRFRPDLILGIHYQGLSYAAILAKIMFKPIRRAIIHYHQEGSDKHVLDNVKFNFNPEEVFKNKRVLIVDNSIESGSTLHHVKKEVKKHTNSIKTLVVYDKDFNRETKVKPDITLFESIKEKQFLK